MRPNEVTEIGKSANSADPDARAKAAYAGLSEALREGIEEDRFPPDEAYWRTRITLTEAAGLLEIPPA